MPEAGLKTKYIFLIINHSLKLFFFLLTLLKTCIFISSLFYQIQLKAKSTNNIWITQMCLWSPFFNWDTVDGEVAFIVIVTVVVLSFQLFSCVQLFVTPWTAAHQASLSFTISWSLLKLMSIELVMPIQPSHLLSSPSPAFNLFQHQGLFQFYLTNYLITLFKKVWIS